VSTKTRELETRAGGNSAASGSNLLRQNRHLARGRRDDEADVAEHFSDALDRLRFHAEAPGVSGEGYGASLAPGGDECPGDAEARAKRVEVGASLSTRADDEQRALGVRGELAGGEHREGRGAPGGDDAAFEEAEPLARRRVHHDDLALDGRKIAARVLRVDRYQLGDGDVPVRGGHD
jgi:hypothetical protein